MVDDKTIRRRRLVTTVLVLLALMMAGVWWLFFAYNRVVTFEVEYSRGTVQIRSGASQGELTRDKAAHGASIVTGSDGMATLTFSDGSRIQVYPGTRLLIRRALSNKGRSRFATDLELDSGEATHWVPRGDNRTRGVSLVTDSVNIGVRGTIYTVQAEPHVARLMVNQGEVAAQGDSGGQIPVGAGYGSVIKAGKAALEPVRLPAPPQITQPANTARINSEPLTLSWRPTGDIRAFDVELALDQGFRQPLSRHRVQGTHLDVPLPEKDGIYFWRVASLEAHGLRGPWSRPERFHLKVYYEQARQALEKLDGTSVRDNLKRGETGLADEFILLRRQGWKNLNGHEYDQARLELTVLSELSPHGIEAILGLARLDIVDGRYRKALDRLAPVLAEAPDNTAALETAAMAWVGLGEGKRALEHVGRALEAQPDSPGALAIRRSLTLGEPLVWPAESWPPNDGTAHTGEAPVAPDQP